jgi:hypothetical protein
MEHFEEVAFDTVDRKLLNGSDTSMTLPRGLAAWTQQDLQQFLHNHNSLRPTITFTKEVEASDTLPLMDVLVVKRGPKLATKEYRKPTHIVICTSSPNTHVT